MALLKSLQTDFAERGSELIKMHQSINSESQHTKQKKIILVQSIVQYKNMIAPTGE